MQRFRSWFGFGDLPIGLSRYIVAVVLVGPIVAVLGLLLGDRSHSLPTLGLAVLLTGLAAAAERNALHLTHKTSVNLGTAAYTAMLLTLPSAYPVLLALIAAAIAQELRLSARGDGERAEPTFNTMQVAVYVGVSVPVYALVKDAPLGPDVGGYGTLGALVLAAAVMHAANTGLVAGAAGLQMGISPLRVWWTNLALDLTPHVTLTMLGLVAAFIADYQPLALLALVVPGILVHRAVDQSIHLRVDTHEALASLVEIVELRDPYTAGHSRRVAVTARLIALRLGLTAEEADVVESAGRVHDIGKVAIDPGILQKNGKLTDEEWAQVREHPVLGSNVVERFAVYQQGARLVRHHHEAWNGGGYPDGLAGEAIPFGARILAVADTFDALTSDRPYREGMLPDAAATVLEEGAGVHWDPRVVRTFLDILRDTPGEILVFSREELTTTVASIRTEAAVKSIRDSATLAA